MSSPANSDSVNSPNVKLADPLAAKAAILANGASASQKGGLASVAGAGLQEAYHILTTDDVLAYVERTLPHWAATGASSLTNKREDGDFIRPGELVSAEEVGDGNLNLVFRLLDRHGVSRAVLKQSLPYVRCVGESWPLTLDRNRLEADTLVSHHAFAPETTEKVLFHNSTMAVTVVEDLSSMVIWRSELVKAHHHAHVVPLLADYLARVHFFTSDFAQDPAEKKRAVQRVINVDMCQITEDLFFMDPFIVHDRNNYEAAQEAFIETQLRQDAALKIKVAQLKHCFMNKAEAHIHGDIHSGSVFIDGTRVKAIDAEFGFYGPMGFDVGSVVGNLLLNYVALPALLQQGKAGEKYVEPASRAPTNLTEGEPASQAVVLASIRDLWKRYEALFLELAKTPGNTRDVTFAFPGYAEVFLRENVLPDTVGFAGAEMIRRTIGLAHVADLDSIENEAARLAAKEAALRLGAALIKGAKGFASIDEVTAFVEKGDY